MSGKLAKSIPMFLMLFIFFSRLNAQTPNYGAANWQLMDWQKDGVRGTSVNRAYDELLKGKKSQPVIVAVIDLGLDTAHEDLQGRIWTNKLEIPGNGIDDDHNGYVDDIHGWNFLGGKDGRNLTGESSELEIEYFRLYSIYGTIHDSSQLGNESKKDYRNWLKVKDQHSKDSLKKVQGVHHLSQILDTMRSADSILKIKTGRDSTYLRDIDNIRVNDLAAQSILQNARSIILRSTFPPNEPIVNFLVGGNKYLDSLKLNLKRPIKDPNANRREIVGDDPDNINDKNYGNNNVAAGIPEHGTHVAGIIAAIRGNGLGLDGIADNVRIMVLRTGGAGGDERDKDVAIAIMYAVDNGARVINMSFGKYYSPGKKWVDDAVQYAEQKDVLLVHAAGNDAADLDKLAFFPNPHFANSQRTAANFITVGATQGGPDSLLVADYSNYSSKEVDLFAPGHHIYSTMPGNKYDFRGGTSNAAPVVTGIAALIMEYYPTLSAGQVKYVLENSVMQIPGLKVKKPGSATYVDFASLSKSQGVVNAYNALKLAATLKGERKLEK